MIKNSFKVDMCFSYGYLWKVGDVVIHKGEYLDTINKQGFRKYSSQKVIEEIIAYKDTLCNSVVFLGPTSSTLSFRVKFKEEDRYYYIGEVHPASLWDLSSRKQYISDYFFYNPEVVKKVESYIGQSLGKNPANKLYKLNHTLFKEIINSFVYRFSGDIDQKGYNTNKRYYSQLLHDIFKD